MTNTFIKALEDMYNYKLTENGARALKSTGSKVYDLFAFGAAYRTRSNADCVLLFKNAYEEDKNLAMKALFYIRDCRGGQGERRFFRVCLNWLAATHPESVIKNLGQVSNMGRWDDLFCLFDTPVEANMLLHIKNQLMMDMEDAMGNKAISLLAKWMPSENASSRITKSRASRIRQYLHMQPRSYRQMLSKLRAHLNVLERLMSANRWDEIEFDKIPSKAGLIYRNAFARRDMIAAKYEKFAKDKNTTVNADTLYPYEIVEKVSKRLGRMNWYSDINFRGDDTERAMLNKYWENQKDYLNGADMSMMCVVDTSGSMYGRPLDVACSLGLYCAERMTGPFANRYISFSRHPKLIKTEGVDFVDKVARIYRANLCENTDLPKVFNLLLNLVLTGAAKKEDLPKTLVVISDMEIDHMSNWRTSTAVTEMDKIREEWRTFGLELPKLVYWNVDARNNTILDRGPGVSFVSGCSPVIFEQVLTGKTGIELMFDVLMKERYKYIMA